jgi:hypothetical protein
VRIGTAPTGKCLRNPQRANPQRRIFDLAGWLTGPIVDADKRATVTADFEVQCTPRTSENTSDFRDERDRSSLGKARNHRPHRSDTSIRFLPSANLFDEYDRSLPSGCLEQWPQTGAVLLLPASESAATPKLRPGRVRRRDRANDTTNEKTPRRSASWALVGDYRGDPGYFLTANFPRSTFTKRASAPFSVTSRSIAE